MRWRFFSLEEINRAEGKKHPWEREWSYGWSMMRVGAFCAARAWTCSTAGTRRPGGPSMSKGASPTGPRWPRTLLAELGLDPGIVRPAIADPTTGDEVLAEHEMVVSKGGFGVPTLIFDDGQALFGPVLVNPPAGKDAVRLWEHVTGWLEFPHVYELQRPKSTADIDAIATAFAPYLEARDWFIGQRHTP